MQGGEVIEDPVCSVCDYQYVISPDGKSCDYI